MPALPWLCYDPVPTAAQGAAPGLVEPDEVLRLARAEPGRYSGERQAAAGVTGTRARAAAPGFSAQQSMWDAMVAQEGRLVGGLPSIPPPGRSSGAARPPQGSLQDAAMDVPAQLLGYSRPSLIQQLVLRKLASALSQPQPPPPPQPHAHAHGGVPPPEGSAAGPSAWPAGDAAAALGPPAALAEPVAAASAAASPSPAAVAQPAASAQVGCSCARMGGGAANRRGGLPRPPASALPGRHARRPHLPAPYPHPLLSIANYPPLCAGLTAVVLTAAAQ
jgi:hypothetical protein